MKKIAVVGTGYVGLVTGTCFAETGNHVTCIDIDEAKVNQMKGGKVPIYEPNLETYFERNIAAGRLSFTTSLEEGIKDAEIIFLALPTPPGEDGSADLSYILGVADELGKLMKEFKVVVDKSTVPVGTAEKVEAAIKKNTTQEFAVVSNPEFLREGSAIEDFMRPDRVICGVESKFSKTILEKLYRPLNLRETPILFSGRETAELIKYASNGFLATKITFINEMADICEKVGADIQEVAKGIGLDGRIGSKFLHPGPGFGGSCFPKDTRALSEIAKEVGTKSRIIDSVIKVNETRKINMVEKIKDTLSPLENKSISILGLTFKPNTDDMRESPSLVIVPELVKITREIKVYDPAGMPAAKKMKEFNGVKWKNNTYDCIKSTDAIVLITEWNEFRALDLDKVKMLLNSPVIIDLRNIYRPASMNELGFKYVSIGRGGI